MSDLDCSNCTKSCEYRDYSYDCYKVKIDEIRKSLTKEEFNSIEQLKNILEKAYEIEYNDELFEAYKQLEEIIDLYKGE